MDEWLIYALLAAASAALVSLFGKIGLEGVDPNAATAVRAIIMAVFLLAVIAAQGGLSRLPDVLSDKRALMFVTLSGIAGALSWLFYFIALRKGTVSQVAPVDKLSVVFAVILAVIFLGEKVPLAHGIGIALITAGALTLAVF